MTQPNEAVTVAEQAGIWQRYKWLLIGAAALILGLLVGLAIIRIFGSPYTYHGTVIQSPDLAADFTLTGLNGEPVSLHDFRGQAVMIYFGYTFCPDVCPATMVELAQASEMLGKDAEKVQVILISLDPDRDTPQKLNEYVTHFDPSFIGITGSEDEIAAVATLYGIFYEKHEGTVATGYLIDHTASVVTIDPDGYLRLVYPFNTPAEDIAEDLQHLVN
ncbi:MAG: SCO family protein [Anaerolineaceae bacterium]|nr:MAG: SCO family protein [Anaerolineaceae bacterium]